MNSGVEIVLARMGTHPEEFYGDNDKWKFIYKEYFRDAMSETEKGAIFDRIKQIRKDEFTQAVMKTITADDTAEREQPEEWSGFKAPSPMPHNQKKTVRLNQQQLAIAREYATKHNMSFQGAVKLLGY